MFQYETQIAGKDITLTFKTFNQMPARISRRLTGRTEAQLWAALEWGLEYPKVWPLREPTPEGQEPEPLPAISTAVQDGIFDDLPIKLVMDIHNKWQNDAGVTGGE